MANRPVYMAGSGRLLCLRENTEFQFYSGFSDAQKKRCIQSLHQSFLRSHPDCRVLEISSHSPEALGVRLSAFNLTLTLRDGRPVSVECAFQAGKIFQRGGPYLDLLNRTSREAKKDPRLHESGDVVGFTFEGETFPTLPRTFFYDWLYIRALTQHPELAEELVKYDAFTDIAFDPEKSINCQAAAAAAYVSLYRKGLLEQATASKGNFLRIVYELELPAPAAAPRPAETVPTARLAPGTRLRHPTYGEGEVTVWEAREKGAVVTVRFSVGEKKLGGAWIEKNCTVL